MVEFVVRERAPTSLNAKPGTVLSNIEHIVAVSSCKGGVGKTTTAVNLALALATKGLRVGLLDADIYGPSLPFILSPKDLTVKKSRTNPKFVLPLLFSHSCIEHDLKMLSFGHVNPAAGVPGAVAKHFISPAYFLVDTISFNRIPYVIIFFNLYEFYINVGCIECLNLFLVQGSKVPTCFCFCFSYEQLLILIA